MSSSSKDFDATFLYHIATGMASAAPLRDLLAHVLEFATSAAHCDSCLIYVVEGDELILRPSQNAHPEIVDSPQAEDRPEHYRLGRRA